MLKIVKAYSQMELQALSLFHEQADIMDTNDFSECGNAGIDPGSDSVDQRSD